MSAQPDVGPAVTWALMTEVDLDTANLHLGALEEAGLLGLVEEDGRVVAYFDRRCEGLPLTGRWEPVEDRDWNAAWKAGIEPVTVGAVTITPPWIEVHGALEIEPAQAFGTGHHETTTACLAALQEIDVQGKDVLDVGTGTGVLALAAKQLGARQVLAVDTDPAAVEAATGNARANGLLVEVRQGSTEVAPGHYDVVAANLDTRTVCELARALCARLADDGILVVSGVSRARVPEAAEALSAAGLAVEMREGLDWAVVTGRPAHRGSL